MNKSEAAKLVAAGLVIEVFDHALGTFDISWLRALVAELAKRGARPWSCDFANIRTEDGSADPLERLAAHREVDPERVRELTGAQLEDPVIYLECPPGTNGGGETHLLVDGIHRLVARRARGLPDFRFWLIPITAAKRFDKRSGIAVPWGEKELHGGKLVRRGSA